MPPQTKEHEGRNWITLGQAAKHIRRKAILLMQDIEAGVIESLELDNVTYIPLAAANRLKREVSFLRKVARSSRIGDTVSEVFGIHAAHRENQEVLPMSSGRDGRDWAGQKPRS